MDDNDFLRAFFARHESRGSDTTSTSDSPGS